jgi:hypothetical protein
VGAEERLGVGVTVHVGGRLDLRQNRPRDVQQGQDVDVQPQLADVVEQGARGVRVVRDVHLAAGEAIDQPGADGAEGDLAALGAGAQAGNVVEEPLDLGPREVGVDDEPCLAAEHLLVTLLLELVAVAGRAAVLPADGVGDRLPGFAAP